MTWNYRVAVFGRPTGAGDVEAEHHIIEAYYEHHDSDVIVMWSEDLHATSADSLDGLKADLRLMLEACEKPVVNGDELPG